MISIALTPLVSEIVSAPTERLLRSIHEFVSPAKRAIAGAGVRVAADGVPFVDYRGTLGRQFNPVVVSQTALAHFGRIHTGDPDARRQFLNCADWLVVHRVRQAGFSTLDYDFAWVTYALTPPWRSGMAQGRALEVLVRAHELTDETHYLDVAHELLSAFFVEVDSGGVTYKSDGKGWWYEEYAQPSCRRSHVLNGMMFAVLGIYDYYEYTGFTDIAAGILFDQGVLSLQSALSLYDHNGDSNYDRLGDRAGPKYHAIHIDQLDQLYAITHHEVFRLYRDRWVRFQNRPLVVRMVLRPTKPGLAVLGFHFLTLLTLCLLVIWVWDNRRKRSTAADDHQEAEMDRAGI